MKKKIIPLLAACAVILVLGIALAALTMLGGEEEEDTGIPLCTIAVDSVDHISYDDGENAQSLTKDGDGNWTLDSDPLLPISKNQAEAVAEDITGLEAQRIMTDDAEVDAMGFDDPEMILTITAGDETFTVTVGAQNTMTDTYYVRTSTDDTVYTVSVSELSSVCKTPENLYEPQRMIDLASDDVATMTVRTGSEELNFTQTDGTWTLTDDPTYELDQDLVSRMASTICEMSSSWSITAPEADSVYGLDAPNTVVTVVGTDGSSVTCSFGSNDPADDGLCYLRSSNAEGVVYEVNSGHLTAYAYTKDTLKAATPETAEDDGETDDTTADYPVGGADTVTSE